MVKFVQHDLQPLHAREARINLDGRRDGLGAVGGEQRVEGLAIGVMAAKRSAHHDRQTAEVDRAALCVAVSQGPPLFWVGLQEYA